MKTENVVLIESLTRTTDPQERGKRRREPGIQAFDAAVGEKILSPEWRVRRLFNVSSLEMLEYVMEKDVTPFSTARNYFIRAMPGRAPVTLGPLIIGERDVFISVAQEDDGSASACIHIQDETIVKLLKQHFQTLLNEPEAITLRDPDGINEKGLAEIRDKVRLGNIGSRTARPQ